MPLRFRRSISLGKFLRLNLSKSGVGVSAGVKGLRAGIGTRGPYASAGLPGTGISAQVYAGKGKSGRPAAPVAAAVIGLLAAGAFLLLLLLIVVAVIRH